MPHSSQVADDPGADSSGRALDTALAAAVQRVIERNWTPRDLAEIARRRLDGDLARLLLTVLALVSTAHPTDPRWTEQLADVDAQPPHERPFTRAWASAADLPWPDAIGRIGELIKLVQHLPTILPVLPAPGSTASAASASAAPRPNAGTAQRGSGGMLHKVRALLAKAESTEFTSEADALMAKAQELMSRYSIDRALAEDEHAETGPLVHRFWIDNPYWAPKSAIVNAVAEANHTRLVSSEDLGFVTIVGHDADLDIVELLGTSLLRQATRAMTSAGPQLGRTGASNTRSYRHAFLLAYASRVGERLRATASDTETGMDSERGGALVPVLTQRTQAVDAALAALFPRVRTRGVSVSNAAGWGAGRAAADLARLDVRQRLDRAG